MESEGSSKFLEVYILHQDAEVRRAAWKSIRHLSPRLISKITRIFIVKHLYVTEMQLPTDHSYSTSSNKKSW